MIFKVDYEVRLHVLYVYAILGAVPVSDTIILTNVSHMYQRVKK